MSARRAIEEDQDKKFRLLFEDNPQPMWVLDPETRAFRETNAAARALYGYTEQEFRGMSLSEVQASEQPLDFPERMSGQLGVTPTAWRHRTKPGKTIDVEIAVYEIDYKSSKAQLAILLDITTRRHLEEQLRQAQKMEAVGMLAGGIAHDFNNLLTIISGYSQLILVSPDIKDSNRHAAEQIMKAGERAAALTRQLLAFSRRQVLQPRVLDLNKLVGSLSTMLQRLLGEDVDLRLILPPDLGRVSADPSQVEQVLMNLAVNSRDAMTKGGVLTIETGNVMLGQDYVDRHLGLKPGPYILLAVSDNGAGMDESTRVRMFEPFFTTKGAGRGTGLGLSTVFGIVKQSGGSVDVYSEPGQGTSVKVYLPRIDQPVVIEAEQAKKKATRGTETILLVEDDEMVRTLVRATLVREGYKVLDFADPVEARRKAEHHKGPIHLLITDVVMPKLSGRELAEKITRRRPDIKVLYMSGYTENAVINSGILHTEVAFLQKPFTPGALTERVREVLEQNGKIHQACE
ncbi:MAG TPA: ATP-binding protein [Bryobacteraceae bacterium]|nr:ATP-binding protein [Bryobacteraceae bacterium]